MDIELSRPVTDVTVTCGPADRFLVFRYRDPLAGGDSFVLTLADCGDRACRLRVTGVSPAAARDLVRDLLSFAL